MAPPVPGIKVNDNGVPDFDDLPLRKTDPHHSAWGLYGDKDELGFLNRLTNDRVASAAKSEINTGQRISLNWPLNAQSRKPFFERAKFHQDMFTKPPRTVNDDVWVFNSQVSTQWDGLRHFGFQKEKLFYNGVTMEEIHGIGEDGNNATVNGIQAWSEQGIVGRGVLVDYHSWREAQGEVKSNDLFASTPIPLDDLKACLQSQGTELKFGDILFIRSGFMSAYGKKTEEEIWELQDTTPHKFVGVEQSEDMLRWIWDNFSAVAGDQPAFECWPTQKDWLLHEVLLGGWGCPIGELFDLEKLSEHCRKEKRWTFFVSSEPCNVPGGVASPPNILAIF
ncbi:uncharacterized protein JN550_008673 [Neoarthrinium moseri]|uniref:uncharacterized protein n=1 Tax=Neoarthrinium moseri TaxID=1658444 RepID=UPI001FDD3A24|nr:uncharacterized protein JN550_008673 [Neoarthrinium moseri]KAI1864853.1 hypothetical protein JN550_008673 [Neoarthrinium moseri]